MLSRKAASDPAGSMWAPLTAPATATPEKTAIPHPKVMTIQPAPKALDLARITPATTPSPRRMRIIVDKISATNFSVVMLTPSVRWTPTPAPSPLAGSLRCRDSDPGPGCLAADHADATVPSSTVAETVRPPGARKRQGNV